MEISQGKSNAKIILMGEHSVVYGKSAIALPFFAANVSASVEKTGEGIEIISDYFKGQLDQAPEILEGIRQLIHAALENLKIDSKGLKISLDSKIPAQRGFGSSAAVSVAITRALFNYAGKTLTGECLKKFVSDAEKIHHDNPSGLDADTITSNHALYYKRGLASQKLEIDMDLDLIVADTGVPASTKAAVQIVSHQKDKDNFIKELGVLSDLALDNIKKKESTSLGLNMTAAHQILKKLGVSTPGLDLLVDAALEAGSLGAKLSGGGLGGCMIALSEKNNTQTILEALRKQGAQSTWVINLKEI